MGEAECKSTPAKAAKGGSGGCGGQWVVHKNIGMCSQGDVETARKRSWSSSVHGPTIGIARCRSGWRSRNQVKPSTHSLLRCPSTA